jgi:hypothetical protein
VGLRGVVILLRSGLPTSREGREKWGTHYWVLPGEQQVPPCSLRSRVGMTKSL